MSHEIMNHALSRASIFALIASLLLYSFAVYAFSKPLSRLAMISIKTVTPSMDLAWHPPASSWITDLDSVVNGTGTYGFYFNGSQLPHGVDYASTYNYCQMPRVRSQEYSVPPKNYELIYVELVRALPHDPAS
jgi:hypothetical protein